MFAGIEKPPPAHVLVADHTGVTLRSYWQAAAAAARPSRLDGAATVRTVLLRAVERELMSDVPRSEEHTSELQSLAYLVCRLLLEKKKKKYKKIMNNKYQLEKHVR